MGGQCLENCTPPAAKALQPPPFDNCRRNGSHPIEVKRCSVMAQGLIMFGKIGDIAAHAVHSLYFIRDTL